MEHAQTAQQVPSNAEDESVRTLLHIIVGYGTLYSFRWHKSKPKTKITKIITQLIKISTYNDLREPKAQQSSKIHA